MQFLAHLKIYSSLTVTVTEWTIVKGHCMLKYNPFCVSKKIPGKELCALMLVGSLKKFKGYGEFEILQNYILCQAIFSSPK